VILIALGSNLPSRYGDSEATVRAALEKMSALGMRVVDSSRIVRTRPVPLSAQPDYANAVASIQTALDPQALLVLLQALEADFGRIRSQERNTPRILDLDILAYNDRVIDEAGLRVPHPRLEARGFVLYPLREIAPNWRHPVSGFSVDEMIAALEGGASAGTSETVAA
jgi:2-amino-4-hydroxy-6-hydroxymethyldihydropteridine diphosphokinase